ncbi:hypothetical protein [Holdemania sp. Marseille-P2844]|jgi:DNA-directed RNA polymerase subunit RPC12/RpoP|uniref:hypothetical protein n=1 Tax=Holdemania sp. Marseille-P2844 TaxID=1852366 RepID=UPI0009328CD0|nr:hypothetical protein [Holdemania sp. Marseille-P2844]
MKCENCGKEVNTLLINKFNQDGSDDEKRETILCPNCKKYPFKDKEIQEYEIVRLVMFKSKENEGSYWWMNYKLDVRTNL